MAQRWVAWLPASRLWRAQGCTPQEALEALRDLLNLPWDERVKAFPGRVFGVPPDELNWVEGEMVVSEYPVLTLGSGVEDAWLTQMCDVAAQTITARTLPYLRAVAAEEAARLALRDMTLEDGVLHPEAFMLRWAERYGSMAYIDHFLESELREQSEPTVLLWQRRLEWNLALMARRRAEGSLD